LRKQRRQYKVIVHRKADGGYWAEVPKILQRLFGGCLAAKAEIEIPEKVNIW